MPGENRRAVREHVSGHTPSQAIAEKSLQAVEDQITFGRSPGIGSTHHQQSAVVDKLTEQLELEEDLHKTSRHPDRDGHQPDGLGSIHGGRACSGNLESSDVPKAFQLKAADGSNVGADELPAVTSKQVCAGIERQHHDGSLHITSGRPLSRTMQPCQATMDFLHGKQY